MTEQYKVLKFESIDFSAKKQHVGLVTPAFAQKSLERNFAENRTLSSSRIRTLKEMIVKGLWIEADPIKFSEDGKLIDGQHRLNALIAAGESLPFRVDTGLPFKSATVLDTGMRRNATHVSQILGKNYTNTHCSIFRMVYRAQKQMAKAATVSPRELVQLMEDYEEAIFFAAKSSGTTRLQYAPVLAAVACAYYHENHKRLSEFLSVWHSGISHGEGDSGAIALRNLYYRPDKNGSTMYRDNFFLKSQSAILAFLQYKTVKNVQPTKKIVWQLEGLYDEQAKTLFSQQKTF